MNANKDLDYAFAISRLGLRILGIWPDPHIPSSDFRRLRFMIVMCTISLIGFVTPMVNVIRAWGNMARMVESFLSVITSLMAMCKFLTTRYYGETLRTLMTSITADWMTAKNNWERCTMLKMARRGRSLSFRYCVIATGLATFFLVFQILRFYHTVHQAHRILIYRIDNIQKSPTYEIIYIVQLFGAVCVAFVNYNIDSFISMLVLHICGQLINLRIAINNQIAELTNRSVSSSKFKEVLATIVIRYEHLIRNVTAVNDCYSPVLFLCMFSATFQLCFTTFQAYTIITDDMKVPVVRIIFLLFYVTNVLMYFYMYCYSAERLLTESTSITYGVYECKWYELPSKDAKDLMLIVYRSMIPLRLTAGKFGTLSLEVFETAIKTSMGYLSALLTMKDQAK